jgi:hypothetical protein
MDYIRVYIGVSTGVLTACTGVRRYTRRRTNWVSTLSTYNKSCKQSFFLGAINIFNSRSSVVCRMSKTKKLNNPWTQLTTEHCTLISTKHNLFLSITITNKHSIHKPFKFYVIIIVQIVSLQNFCDVLKYCRNC